MSVTYVTVGADEAEQRLDRWMRRRWPHVGQGRIEKMCRKGEIRVDGSRTRASDRIAPGQVVRVPPIPEIAPPDRIAQSRPDHGRDHALERTLLDAIVYRDDHILVINKPAGLAVQGGSGQNAHLGTALSALSFDREDLPRLVHRLDRDTSGLLVLARTGVAATALGRTFRSREIKKIYYAAVAGKPSPAAGTIRYGLVKSGGAGHERMTIVHPDAVRETEGARSALTDYETIEQAGSRMAWVALHPVTGRTHQLRAHMAAIGCPIAGDGKYGGRGQENLGDGWQAGLGGALSRKLHLHAARLVFPHPISGKMLRLDATLPEHMARTWSLLGWSLENVSDAILER